MEYQINKTTNPYAFGYNLVPILKKRKITYQQLADQLGVHHNTIGAWCNGLRSPSAIHLFQIAKILGVTMEELMKGTDQVKAGNGRMGAGGKHNEQ